ncbi:unnamed protein product [Ixodes hexagonus]
MRRRVGSSASRGVCRRAFAGHVFLLPVDPGSEASFAILPRRRVKLFLVICGMRLRIAVHSATVRYDERRLPSTDTKSGLLGDGPRVFERSLRGSADGRTAALVTRSDAGILRLLFADA